MNDIINPSHHLQAAMRDYPTLTKDIENFRASKGHGLPDWPNWCFLPMAGYYAIVSREASGQFEMLGKALDISRLAALGAWRYSQGIYQFSPEILSAIAGSSLAGDIPSEVLYRLPEWCVYIETPGMKAYKQPLHGFWAHLEWDTNSGRSELRFLLNSPDRLIPLILHLGDWSVIHAVELVDQEAGRVAKGAGMEPLHDALTIKDVADIADTIRPLLSLVLYLCSSEPDVVNAKDRQAKPSYASPRKTKLGIRLFAPAGPQFWKVGERIADQIMQSASVPVSQSGEKRTVRPHIRRAHWHGYWTGERKSMQSFVYRWTPPQLIGID